MHPNCDAVRQGNRFCIFTSGPRREQWPCEQPHREKSNKSNNITTITMSQHTMTTTTAQHQPTFVSAGRCDTAPFVCSNELFAFSSFVRVVVAFSMRLSHYHKRGKRAKRVQTQLSNLRDDDDDGGGGGRGGSEFYHKLNRHDNNDSNQFYIK